MSKLTALEALDRLRDGNRRYVAGDGVSAEAYGAERRRAILAGPPQPIAIVLGCLDSRVTPEIVFSQGLGDLLVLRVAGNIASPQVVGSIEMAAKMFGTRLVVVLGHSRCGAVQLTAQELNDPQWQLSPELQAIMDHITPAVEGAADAETRAESDHWMQDAVRANVLTSITRLRDESEALQLLAAENGLRVVGAEYDVETGVVEFFDGVSDVG
jgi:carbonic anhydrase